VTVPSFRPDLIREIDLIEEVARIYGYNEIPDRFVAMGPLGVERDHQAQVTTILKDTLVACGFSEVWTNSFTGKNDLMTDGIVLSNPISEDVSYLRPSLLSGLLDALRWNLHHGAETIRIFEIGRVFRRAVPVREEVYIAGLATGFRETRSWDRQPAAIDFYDLKGILEACFERLSDYHLRVEPLSGDTIYDDHLSASVALDGERIGEFGQIRPEILKAFDIDASPLLGFEFPMEAILRVDKGEEKSFRPLPRYPAVTRDLAVVLDEKIPAAGVISTVQAVNTELIEAVDLFDVYRGAQIPSGKKSLALSCVFRSRARTLLDDEADQLCEAILRRLYERFGAVLRS
jgi:phenylalanyl-tRNA synthetase beta chain